MLGNLKLGSNNGFTSVFFSSDVASRSLSHGRDFNVFWRVNFVDQ